MTFTYIECPAVYRRALGGPRSVFLAGGIAGAEVREAADRLNKGDSRMADRLTDKAERIGGQAAQTQVAMAILAASVD